MSCSIKARPPASTRPALPAPRVQPVLSFDLGSPVGDLAWAPFSSTVFAAATDAGRVAVFDLAQNRGAPACWQRVVRKSRLTRLAFNARHPVLLVGDEAGCVHCLKLSPSLRRSFNQGEARSARTHAHAHSLMLVGMRTQLTHTQRAADALQRECLPGWLRSLFSHQKLSARCA